MARGPEPHANMNSTVAALVDLARALGMPPRQYAILGEGNIAARVDAATFLVKASGAALADAVPESFTHIDLGRTLALVHDPPPDDGALGAALMATRVDSAGARPSVETGMHAILLAETGARWVAHTHPAAITGVLCSTNAEALVAGALFPDQVVVCGRAPLLLPYVDPGVPLARALRAALDRHMTAHGAPPRAIYLRNHGFVALGQSAVEVLAITDMAVKAALVLATALACGGPCYLSPEDGARIAGRADEHHRRRVLGLSQGEG